VNRIAVLGLVLLGLIAIGSQADEIRSSLNGVATGWFHTLQKPGREVNAQRRAWDAFAAKADALCASYAHQDFAAQVASPRSRADWLREVRAGLARERDLQVALSAMHAPGNYEVGYRKFLRDREAALSLRSTIFEAPRNGRTATEACARSAATRSRKVRSEASPRAAGYPRASVERGLTQADPVPQEPKRISELPVHPDVQVEMDSRAAARAARAADELALGDAVTTADESASEMRVHGDDPSRVPQLDHEPVALVAS
jgi:hypothetical protein